MMRKIAKRAGVKQANPHKFRRTCATMALRRGMPLEQVSKMLGHENIATTQIYLDLRHQLGHSARKQIRVSIFPAFQIHVCCLIYRKGGDGYGVERSGYTSYGKEIKKRLIDRDI